MNVDARAFVGQLLESVLLHEREHAPDVRKARGEGIAPAFC